METIPSLGKGEAHKGQVEGSEGRVARRGGGVGRSHVCVVHIKVRGVCRTAHLRHVRRRAVTDRVPVQPGKPWVILRDHKNISVLGTTKAELRSPIKKQKLEMA